MLIGNFSKSNIFSLRVFASLREAFFLFIYNIQSGLAFDWWFDIHFHAAIFSADGIGLQRGIFVGVIGVGTGFDVEREAMVGAGERLADEVTILQRQACVGAGIGDGVHRALDVEHHEIAPAGLNALAAIGGKIFDFSDIDPLGHVIDSLFNLKSSQDWSSTLDQQFIQTQKIVIEQAHHFLKSEPTEDAWWLRPAADLLVKNDVKLHEKLIVIMEQRIQADTQYLDISIPTAIEAIKLTWYENMHNMQNPDLTVYVPESDCDEL